MDETSADQVSAEVAGEAPAPPRRPATRPYSRLISGVLLLILVVLTIDVLVHGPLTRLDERIRAAVLARADSPAWRWLGDTPHSPAPLLTDLGMNTVAVPVLAAVAVALAVRRHTLRPLLIAATGVVLLLGTVIPAKIIIGRPGPGLPAVLPGQLGCVPIGAHQHRVHLLLAGRADAGGGPAARTRYLAVAGLALLWLGVGAALVWCDWHWFTDVAAGWALSALLIQLTFWINRAGKPLDGRPL